LTNRFARLSRTLRATVLAAGAIAMSSAATYAAGLNDPACLKARPAAFDALARLDAAPKTIVAIGSSSTEGIARNDKSMLYPAAMERALAKRWPNAGLHVVNKGKGGEVMAETIARFERDVIALKPDLVIWQLGVNDVLRFQGVDGRREEIRKGLAMLSEKGIPVILVDLQYAPIVIRDPDSGAMQDLIDSAVREGVRGRVFHFRRFAIMKDLAERQAVAPSEMTEQDGLHMTDMMHTCVGVLLAEMITLPVVSARAP
jgi:acyl-CoA thioesterase I